MDIRRRVLIGGIKKATSGGFNTDGSYTVNLNGQWEETTAVPNPDSTLFDGVYRSSSNYNVNNGYARMYITIKDCSSFTLFIRSYAESGYDYMMVSQLDKTITGNTSYSNTTLVKDHTRNRQQSGTALSNYRLVEFTEIPPGEHTITVVYRKDSSTHSGDDRGYVLIPKIKEEGDTEIDTTYSMQYTSSDGNIVTPYDTSVFGADIISNNYINGQGIISFKDKVTKIGNAAFYNCDTLTSITIPNSVTSLGSSAFSDCNNLTSITIPNSVTSIDYYTFSECNSLTSITIPDSVTAIGDYAFRDCTSLTSVNISNSMTNIGSSVFNGCESLTSVNIPSSVKWIGNRAFQNCDSLTSITIPDSVTTIEYGAFYDCDSLASVNIPDSVTSIGQYAFAYCPSLTEFTGKFVEDNGRILVIDGVLNAFAIGCGVTQYTIPDNVTSIGFNAFGGCTSLTSVNIPDSVTTIEYGAFENCYSLTSITIPDSVTTIEYGAFRSCTSLASVTIPDIVTTIGDYAFYYCPSLTSVYCKATTPPSLGGTSVFDYNGSGRKIYVPTESVDAYKSATNWSEYADAIVGYDFEDGGEESGGNLITFTVDGVEYQAEEGMTWEEWCNSEYNVGGFIYDLGEAGYAIYTSDREKYFLHQISDDDLVTTGAYLTRDVNWPVFN